MFFDGKSNFFQVRERMTYVGSVLEEFVELDEQVVPIKWSLENLNSDNIRNLTNICNASVNKSANPPLPRSESSMSKYFLKYFHADLYEPKFQDLLIFGCVYSLLDYLSFPFWFSEKIFQSSPCKSNLEM